MKFSQREEDKAQKSQRFRSFVSFFLFSEKYTIIFNSIFVQFGTKVYTLYKEENMKKTLSVLLAMAMTIGLVACGGASANKTTTGADQTTAAGSEKEAAEDSK